MVRPIIVNESAFIHDPSRIPERRARGIKYVVIGHSPYGMTEIAAHSETHAKQLGSIWKEVYVGTAYCYCVQDGEVGGRPFHTFW